MAVLLITYDLNKEKKARDGYAGLLAAIKKFAWARLSESSYAIETTSSPSEIFELFKPHLDSDDYLTVITLNRPWWGHNSKAVSDWLLQRL